MCFAPVVFGRFAPCAGDLIPGYPGNEFTYAIAGDLMLLVSLFVLGDDFQTSCARCLQVAQRRYFLIRPGELTVIEHNP